MFHQKIKLALTSAMAVFMIGTAHAQMEEEGLEFLLFQEIPIVSGTLTQTQKNKSPVSTTVITREQLKLAPARNLYDVLEIFVPGFQYRTHFDSSHMGVRGQLINRDYTWILLVNGVFANQTSHNGIVSELENWDLNDIEKIEVVRGPGSVTYGPGAVAGVISITTKGPSTVMDGTEIGVQYVSEYDSKGLSLSHNIIGENFGFLTYVSITDTDGYDDPDILTFAPPSSEAKYVKPQMVPGTNYVSPVLSYHPDYDEKPQIKAYAELDFKNVKIWGRYTRSGTTRYTVWTHDTVTPSWFLQSRNSSGDFENNPAAGAQQFMFAAENTLQFENEKNLRTTVSYSSIDRERLDTASREKGNYVLNYSENRFLITSIFNFSFSDTFKSAIGVEYATTKLDQGWGDDDEDEFIMDDGVLFISRPNSPALAARSWISVAQQAYTTNYTMDNYAIFGELSKSFNENWDFMFSGRFDKHELSSSSFSPRFSIIYNNDNIGLFKFNIQRSIRENTGIQLASADYFNNKTPEPEEFDGLELIYSKQLNENSLLEIALFQSKADLLGWSSGAQNAVDAGDERATTAKTGSLEVGGVEVTYEYANEARDKILGINHAFAKELDFELAAGESGSYISRSDSNNSDPNGIFRASTGDDRMNWSNHFTKLYAIYKPTSKLTLFNSFRINWGSEGDKNWLKMYKNGIANLADQEVKNRTQQNIDTLEDEDIFELDIRFDLSVSYAVTDNIEVVLFGQNLINFTDKNWRYVYIMEGGAAVDEPTVFGLRSTFKF